VAPGEREATEHRANDDDVTDDDEHLLEFCWKGCAKARDALEAQARERRLVAEQRLTL
jgi:hypothetical protein